MFHLAILLLLRVLIDAKFLDRVAFVSLEIFLQNLISVHFLQKYQVTVVFAVPLCKKTHFYVSVAARQVPVAHSNVKIEQKGYSHYYNETRMSFDFFTKTFPTDYIVDALI